MHSRAILLLILLESMISGTGYPSDGSGEVPAAGPGEQPVDLGHPERLSWIRIPPEGISVKDGVLEIDGISHPDSAVFFSEPEVLPEGARFEFRIDEAGEGARGFGFIFSARSSMDYLYLHFDRHRQVILVRSDGDESWREIVRRGDLEYGTGEWHQARVETKDGAVRVSLDGKPILSRDGVKAGPGRFGFYVSDGRARVRNVILAGAPARLDPLWREVRRPIHHVVVCADAGAGGYQAFPDVCLRKTGEMVCVFYAGFGHVSLPSFAPGGKLPPECPKNGRVCLVRSADFGRTWSKAEVVVDTPLDDRDPSIAELPDGSLLVTYFSLDVGPDGKGYRFISSSLVRSADGGRTWGTPDRLFPDWAISSPARILSGGRIALSLYYVVDEASPGKAYGGVSFSRDGGNTWSAPIPVGKDGPLALDAEPDILELPDGRLLMALRPVLAVSWSKDGGLTWSAPERIGFEAHCPYFLRLPSGVILLAHRIPGTSLHFSLDDGKTWSANVSIDSVGGAYPSLCALPGSFPEGAVFVAYYEEGPRSKIRGRWLRATREGVRFIEPPEI